MGYPLALASQPSVPASHLVSAFQDLLGVLQTLYAVTSDWLPWPLAPLEVTAGTPLPHLLFWGSNSRLHTCQAHVSPLSNSLGPALLGFASF